VVKLNARGEASV